MGVAVEDQSVVQVFTILLLIYLRVTHVECQKSLLTCLIPCDKKTELCYMKCWVVYRHDIIKKALYMRDCFGHMNKCEDTCVNITNPVRPELFLRL
jgi:hypothetical protein